MELFKSLENRTKSFSDPFNHFEINEPLTENAIKEISTADVLDPKKENLNYDGTRALDGGDGAFRSGIKDGGKAKKLRCYVTKENANQFPHLTNFIEELRSEKVYKKIGSLIGKDLSNSYVRLEVICDREGFWLKPHCDIKEKLMSSIIFINLHKESDLFFDWYLKYFIKNKKISKIKKILRSELNKIYKKLNFKNIKINAVLLKGVNDTEKDFNDWAEFVKNNEIDFRYIELMQTGDNLDYFNNYHVPAKKFTDYLNNNNWIIQTFGKDSGPSKNYLNPKFKGKFGIIAPYSKDFCKSCNRLRITAKGDLRLCLFGNTGINIRHLMQKDSQIDELKDLILKQLNFKKESHSLEIGETGLTKNLSTTGG